MTFGDFDPADAVDVEPADPEQVAVKLQALRLAHGFTSTRWRDLTDAQRAARIALVAALLAWLRRQGAW